MSEIRVLCFDCGGVFLTNGWDHHGRRRALETFGLDVADFESRHEEPNDRWERGIINIHQYLDETIFYRPRSFSHEEFIEAMRDQTKVLYPEMIEFVRQLAADGKYKLYMLSNESRELMQYRLPNFGLYEVFDAYLVSAYIGLRKPHADFYERSLEIILRPPSECVFVDDRQENIAAAAAFGMHGVRLDSPAQVFADLAKLGIPTPATQTA